MAAVGQCTNMCVCLKVLCLRKQTRWHPIIQFIGHLVCSLLFSWHDVPEAFACRNQICDAGTYAMTIRVDKLVSNNMFGEWVDE